MATLNKKCCEYKKYEIKENFLKHDLFWLNVRSNFIQNFYGKLFYSTAIEIPYDQGLIKIGYNPWNSFEIGVTIESKSLTTKLLFTDRDIGDFFELLKKLREDRPASDVKCVKKSTGIYTAVYKIQKDDDFYQLSPDLALFIIKEEKNVKSIINHYKRKQSGIKNTIMRLYSIYYNFYEKENKTFTDFCNDFKFKLDCDCFDKKLVYEMLINFYSFFHASFHVFYRMCMHNEKNRYETFTNTEFIQKDVPFRKYAQQGFYYTGDHSLMRCFDCDLVLDFQKNNNVLRQHLKLSPNCFLLNNKSTINIPIKRFFISDAEKTKAMSII